MVHYANSMFKNCLVLILVMLAGRVFAQQDFFVLIHTENRQPFYVLMDNKTYPSSPQGYLILSQLKGGAYPIRIGSPSGSFPDLPFTLHIAQKDLELELKDLGDRGWGLYNPQSLELKMPDQRGASVEKHLEGVKKDDAFSRMMAGVVSDTAVMYNTYAMDQVLKDSPVVKAESGRQSSAGAPAKQVDTVVTRVDSARNEAAVEMGASTEGSVKTAIANHIPKDTVRAEAPVSLVSDTVQRLGRPEAGAGASTTSGATGASGATTAVTTSPASTTSAASSAPTAASATDTATKLPVSKPVHKAGAVAKIGEHKSTTNWRGVYTDKGAGKRADTIVVIIPADTLSKAASGKVEMVDGTGAGRKEPGAGEGKLTARVKPDTAGSTGSAGSTASTGSTGSVKGTAGAGTGVAANKGAGKPGVSGTNKNTGSVSNGGVGNTGPGAASANTSNVAGGGKVGAGTGAVAGQAGTGAGQPGTVAGQAAGTGAGQPGNPAGNTGVAAGHSPASPAENSAAVTSQTEKKPASKIVLVNTDCKNFATEYDLDKLRVKMLEGGKDEDRIATARKVFKTKCFTTRQIRALSEVFTADAVKYRFFETAYPFVSDDKFGELANLLADPVYNSKFKAMTGQK